MLDDLTRCLESKPSNKTHLLYELAQCISAAIDADQFNIYIHSTIGHITKFALDDLKEKYVCNNFFGSDRSPKCQDVVRVSINLCDISQFFSKMDSI